MPYRFSVPIGTVLDFAGFAIPSGWLECNGASLLRASYPALLEALSTTQACTFTATTTNVTVVDSSLFCVTAPVESSKLPAGTTVSSIVDGTHITVSQAATSSGVASATFFPYGAADVTHFNLPNAKGRVLVGLDTADTVDFGWRGKAGGNKVEYLTTGQVPCLCLEPCFCIGSEYAVTGYDEAGGSHDNMQPYLVVRKIIKT